MGGNASRPINLRMNSSGNKTRPIWSISIVTMAMILRPELVNDPLEFISSPPL